MGIDRAIPRNVSLVGNGNVIGNAVRRSGGLICVFRRDGVSWADTGNTSAKRRQAAARKRAAGRVRCALFISESILPPREGVFHAKVPAPTQNAYAMPDAVNAITRKRTPRCFTDKATAFRSAITMRHAAPASVAQVWTWCLAAKTAGAC